MISQIDKKDGEMKTNFFGKEISGEFTIPSGIITTNVSIIKKIIKEIPQIGVITTKSIGLEPKWGNREPIITQYAPSCFSNAVGLTNPGAEEFAKQLSDVTIPNDRFLLISIFGKDENEFVEVAKKLEKYADGFELNLSCPHAKGYGMAIGQDPIMVKQIVSAVKNAVNKPIVAKLTPNAPSIADIAKAAVEGGADGICAINTVGPGYYTVEGNPVLSNKKGGLSGKGIFPIGLKCVKEISEAVSVPIIGCGGVSSSNDVKEYKKAGATIIGIGSALYGLSTKELKNYFSELEKNLESENNSNSAEKLLREEMIMNFKKFKLKENKKLADDLSILIFEGNFDIKAGQFIFLWIPGEGEKPFSVLDNTPLTLLIQKVGCFTEKLVNLKEGTAVYFRGPYGVPIEVKGKPKIILVGGGCGNAALYQIAKDFENTEMFFGARDKNHLCYTEQIKKHCPLEISTNDGSEGYKGFVTEILEKRLREIKEKDVLFFNCGPEVMINAAKKVERKYFSADKIFNSIDYKTKCGVGICGSCATKNGKRICVDGPFINEGEENEN